MTRRQRLPYKAGRAYLFREPVPALVFRALEQAIQSGFAGLAVSRSNAASLPEDYGLEEARIVWLTEARGEDRVSPTNVDGLVQAVTSLVAQHGRAVVAFDGVEYLLERLGSDTTIQVLRTLRDLVTGEGGVFLVSVDDATVDSRLKLLFRHDFETVPDRMPSGFNCIDVFVIDARSGILLSHVEEEPVGGADADVVAGMLTVIMDFAKTSFARGTDELRQFEMGDTTILIERGSRFLIVVAFTGQEPPSLRPRMHAFAGRAERQCAELLEQWSGDLDALHGLDGFVGDAFLSRVGGRASLRIPGRGAPTESSQTQEIPRPRRARSPKAEE